MKVIYRMSRQEKEQVRELQRLVTMNQAALRAVIMTMVEREGMPPNTVLDDRDLVFRSMPLPAPRATLVPS